MTRLRAGVIGAGAMGGHHVRVLGEIPGAEPVVVVDPDPRALELGLPVITEVSMLADLVDLAILAAPSALHEKLGVELAQLGVPTLVEKPITTSTAAGIRLVRAFAQAGTAAAAGHIERFNPVVTALCHALDTDAIGRVTRFETSRVGPFPDRDMPVGVVADLLVHDIDLACFLFDARYSTVTARARIEPGRPCEDEVHVTGDLVTHKGSIAVAHRAGRLSPSRERTLRIEGNGGTLVGDLIEQTLILHRADHTTQTLPVHRAQPLAAELSAFCDVVRGHPDPVLATLADGLRAVSVAEAVLASASAGEPVTPEVAA